MELSHKIHRKPLWKRILISFLLASVLSVFCTGCLPGVELSDRAIVQAIGVDALPDGGVKVTMQIFSPGGTGGATGIDASKSNAKIIESTGRTLSDAISAASLKQGKQIFYGHNRVVIFGESAAKSGLYEYLSFFNNDHESRANLSLMISRSTAADIVKAEINQGILPAEVLEKMADNAQQNGKAAMVTFFDVQRALENPTDDVVIPAIELSKSEGEAQEGKEGEGKPEDVQAISMDGSALFADGKLAGYMDDGATRGLLWLRGEVCNTLLTASDPALGEFSVDIYDSSTKLIPQLQDGHPVFQVKIRGKATLNELVMKQRESLSMKDLDRLGEIAASAIQRECGEAFAQTAEQRAIDVCAFGNLLWQQETDYWRQVHDDWKTVLPTVRLQYDIRIEIDRVGMGDRLKSS